MASLTGKVWLITGSSTGFGRSLTEAVLKHGDRVVATARKPEQLSDLVEQYPQTLKAVRLDVTNPTEVKAAVGVAHSGFDRIDVLVNIFNETQQDSPSLTLEQMLASGN